MVQNNNSIDEPDLEITAMAELGKIINPLSTEARQRVLQWACARFLAGKIPAASNSNETHTSKENITSTPKKYEDFVDLFDATQPNTAAEKVLVTAYWFKTNNNQETFTSQPINSALKDLGHGISHMPSALSALESQQPALVRQMQKSGKSQQARKTYKITDAGLKAVEAMIKTTTYMG